MYNYIDSDKTYFNKKEKIVVSSVLTKLFIFLGVMGTLIPIPKVPDSFRFYYIILPIIIIYFCFSGVKRNVFKYIVLSIPLFIYLLVSSWMGYGTVNISQLGGQVDANENPFFRLGLLYCLFISTILLASYVKKRDIETKLNLIEIYLKGFFITLIFGYIFFIGYYKGVVSKDLISEFQIQVQGAYGLLRMSPGSYPNEYGNVSSFVLSILTLFFFYKKQLSEEKIIFNKKRDTLFYLFFWIMTLVALFLTTTRSAYLSYVFALIYLIFSQKRLTKIIKSMLLISVAGVIIFWFAQNYIYDIKSIFITAYNAFFNEQSSSYVRFNAWEAGWIEFQKHYAFGIGFGTLGDMHNVYLQMLFEIGLIGILILLFTFVIYFKINHNKVKVDNSNIKYFLLLKVKNLAVLHVLWFATNNHNLNHHLTWFCVLLLLISNYKILNNKTKKKFKIVIGNKQ